MIELPLIHFDCRHFMGDKPCFANKQFGVFCHNCQYYEKDINTGRFPVVQKGTEFPASDIPSDILIIKLDAAGDVLRTTSLLPSIKNKTPVSVITWITKSGSSGILEDNPLIDSIHLIENEINSFEHEKFDIAINLDSAIESCKIMSRVAADKKYGFTLVNNKPFPVSSYANEWYLMGIEDNFKKLNTKTYHRIIHEICGLKYNDSRPMLEMTNAKEIQAAFLREKFKVGNFEEFILINLGGGSRWQFKKWTQRGYSDLIENLSYRKPNSAIGIIAGKEDEEFYNEVLRLVSKKDNIKPLGCHNTLKEFICSIYLSDKIFTSDSLAFHIATALNKYVVVIVGPTSHTELDVFGNGEILYSDKVDCLSCYLNKCGKTVNCMNTVDVNDVIGFFL